jgi:hypothetical protein
MLTRLAAPRHQILRHDFSILLERSSDGPVALPSRYGRTAGPEFDKSSKKSLFFRALELCFLPGRLNIRIGF